MFKGVRPPSAISANSVSETVEALDEKRSGAQWPGSCGLICPHHLVIMNSADHRACRIASMRGQLSTGEALPHEYGV